MLRREIDQTLHPEAVTPLRVNGVVVDERALRAIIVFVFLYLGVVRRGRAWSSSSTRRCADVDLTAFQSLAVVGQPARRRRARASGSPGRWGRSRRFSDFSTLVLTALMYLGRLEIVPVLVLFTAQPLARVSAGVSRRSGPCRSSARGPARARRSPAA